MSKRLLSEQIASTRSMKLIESSAGSNPGCLGTMYGVCADYKNVTRNGTFYSRKLWENVFNSDLVKEALEDRLLFGELGHPQDRLETDLTKACIVMREYEFDDDEQVVKGKFDILNTPSGRVLKSLLDYGCVAGLSSRGEGDVETVDGVDRVDEDTYYFVGFDAVALPSVKKAKPTLTESVQHKSLKESLMKEVDGATSLSQLEMIKNVLKSTNLPDVDSLMESIDIKSKELTEGTTSTEDPVLLEDLEKANQKIKELEGTIESLNEEVITGKSRVKKILESNHRLVEKLRSLRRSHKDLEEDYSKLVFESASSSKKIKSLEETLNQRELRIEELTSEVRTTRSSNIKINNKVRSLSESAREADQKRIASEKSLAESTEVIKSKDDELHALRESVEKLESEKSSLSKQNAKLTSDYSGLLESYTTLKSQINGLDSKKIMESVKAGSSAKDVDTIVESVIDQNDRYSSLKIMKDPLLESYDPSTVRISSNQVGRSEKDQNSISFLEETLGKTL